MIFDTSLVEKELSKGLGDGPLTLEVVCTKCDARFELNKESVAMAILTNTSFIEYLRWVQNGSCHLCLKKIVEK